MHRVEGARLEYALSDVDCGNVRRRQQGQGHGQSKNHSFCENILSPALQVTPEVDINETFE